MLGLMMDTPLLISSIATHAERFHGGQEIVSVTADNPRHRYTYRECFGRAKQLAAALHKLGIDSGDRVATMCWNDYRHLEAYYGVSGAGFVCHTINPRLFPEQLVFIINHAEDRWIMTDLMFVPLLESLADKIGNVEGYIIMTDAAHMPKTTLRNVVCYETLLAAESGDYTWPTFDERSASALCLSRSARVRQPRDPSARGPRRLAEGHPQAFHTVGFGRPGRWDSHHPPSCPSSDPGTHCPRPAA
jgi:fatty-acyl-CoA synthase